MYRPLTVAALCVGLSDLATYAIRSLIKTIEYLLRVQFSNSLGDNFSPTSDPKWNAIWLELFLSNMLTLVFCGFVFYKLVGVQQFRILQTYKISLACSAGLATAIFGWLFLFTVARFKVDTYIVPGLSAVAENTPLFVALFLVTVVLLGPIVEEIINRGIAFELLKESPEVTRFIVCVVPWTLMHISSGNSERLLITLVSGTVFYWIRCKSGSVGYSIAAHSANNFVILLLS
jgi:membrane protease YdiL (CAAX protease family)